LLLGPEAGNSEHCVDGSDYILAATSRSRLLSLYGEQAVKLTQNIMGRKMPVYGDT